MTRENINPQAILLFFNLHQSRLRFAVVILLSIYLIAFGAELVWRIIPIPAAQNTKISQGKFGTQTGDRAENIDIGKIQSLHLFGRADKSQLDTQDEPEITDAPKTRLKLVLSGVVASSEKRKGTAVIEHKGKQGVYGIGEKIENTRATLDQVQVDRVIIRNNGKYETLMLEGFDYEKMARANQADTKKQQKATNNKSTKSTRIKLENDAREAALKIREAPSSFTDYISVNPSKKAGEMVGYKVRPGKDPALFKAAGLKNGDVITEINGLDVASMENGADIMTQLKTSDSLELVVTRRGKSMSLVLDLPQQ